ncbi:MAG: Wzz/FepE/Etk N-terminal domain-containing protein [Planctomycetota bacterium]
MNQTNLPAPAGGQTTAVARLDRGAASPALASAPIVQAEPAVTLLEILLRHKVKMIACVFLALCLGVVYQLTATRIYESSAEVFVERTNAGQPNSPLAPGGISAGLPSTHASLMGSTPVLRSALRDPAIAELETFAGIESEAQRLKLLKKSLSINFSKELETVSIAFRGKVQDETALIVNAVVDAYQRRLQVPVQVDGDGGFDVTDADAMPTGVMSEQLIAGRITQLAEEQTAAQMKLESANIRLEEAQKAEGDLSTLASLLEDAGMSSGNQVMAEMAYLKAELARTERNLESMPPSWGPSHSVRGPLERQADAMRYEIGVLYDSAASTMMGLLKSNQKNAEMRVDELNQRLASQQSLGARVTQLPIDRIEPATTPLRKVAPKGTKTLGISLFLGIAAGIGWILLAELKSGGLGVEDTQAAALPAPPTTSPMLLRSDDMEETLSDAAPPMLGLVPEVPMGRRLTSPNFDATASSIHQIRAVLQVQAGTKNAKAFAFTSPRRGAGKTSVTIGVASSLAMSGTKTLVVDCDLAGRIARGQTGKPAAGNSSDRPEANQNGQVNGHDRFGPIDPEGSSPDNASMDNIVIEEGFISDDNKDALAETHDAKVGVTGMLDGGTLAECAVDATVPGLSLLPAVHARTHHIGMMSDAFIRRLIEEAQGTYDLVLFDTGPVPGSVEALLVTSQVDGVVIVVPQGEAKQALTRTMSYLKVVGANIFGTVFNRASDAPEPGTSNASSTSIAGAAATASAAAASRSAVNNAGDDPLIELEKHQQMTDDDGEFLEGDAPLGSGILAAAVFSDADSAFASNDWKLEETSEFNGSVEELFGKVDESSREDTDELRNG